MMRVAVFKHQAELTDTHLQQMAALGADCLDFGRDTDMPGVAEQGYPDLARVLALKKRLRSFGLDINRVTIPNFTQAFMEDQAGGEDELELAAKALRVYGEAGLPIARQRFEGDVFPDLMTRLAISRRFWRQRSPNIESGF